MFVGVTGRDRRIGTDFDRTACPSDPTGLLASFERYVLVANSA